MAKLVVLKSSAVPDSQEFLSAEEMAIVQSFRFAKKVESFCMGRYAAKQALEITNGSEVSILNSKKQANYGAPEVFGTNRRVSISHRENIAAAVSFDERPVGVDLEKIEIRHASFAREVLSDQELQRWQKSLSRSFYETLVWSAKEAVSKVLFRGMQLPVRQIKTHYITDQFNRFLSGQLRVLSGFASFENQNFHLFSRRLSADSTILTLGSFADTDIKGLIENWELEYE